jgi:hypothetical protein
MLLGMLIDVNEQSQNAWPSMRLSRDPSRNPKAAICLHDEKQKYRMTSTLRGTTTSGSFVAKSA